MGERGRRQLPTKLEGDWERWKEGRGRTEEGGVGCGKGFSGRWIRIQRVQQQYDRIFTIWILIRSKGKVKKGGKLLYSV